MKKQTDVIIYNNSRGVAVEIKLQSETLWMPQRDLAGLFGVDRSVVAKHIKNIYNTGELDENSTCAKIAQVQTEGRRRVERDIEFYSLDMILSVGYRVNSKNATAFRIWATRILKQHLVDGYTINEKRLMENSAKISDIRRAINIVERGISNKIENLDDAKKLVRILSDFAGGLELLDNYDHEKLDTSGRIKKRAKKISVAQFLKIIVEMAKQFPGDLFAKPKDDSFAGSVNQIYQTVGGRDAYPTVTEKAAMLLYLITKNHSFADGNKRIAASCFLYFLNENGILYRADGTKIINGDALAALTLLVAESKPSEMNTMKNIIVSILNKK
ncbi:MAG: virulence protein RhuM/Fic/DOC family protein [Rickettsiales bacterium]|jgi:prophage maintenance system killer protein|nr:virulence protein RhuM/Fic/DOC family protein [Rickettsiales bacterium]